MKSLFTFLVAALMVLSFSVAGFAQTSTGGQMGGDHQTMTGKMSSGQHLMTYKGKVVSMNDSDHTLVVNGKEGDKTFDMSKVTTTGNLKTGSKVKVSYYTDTNGHMVVSSIKGHGIHTTNQYGSNQYGASQYGSSQYGSSHMGSGYDTTQDQG